MLGRDSDVLSKNGYVYVKNNPLKYVDASGEEGKAIAKEIDTDWFIGTLRINAQYMEALREGDENLNKWYLPIFTKTLARADTYIKFYNLVKSGGPWDYKEYYGKKYSYEVQLKIAGVYDKDMNYEAPGNINFGFTGAAAGIPKDTLLLGAGIAQILGHTAELKGYNSYFDDPKDQLFIKVGYTMYEHYGSDIDEKKLNKALNWYVNKDGFILNKDEDYWKV